MGIFQTNSEVGKPMRTWPQRLNAILASICEALGISMDQQFTGAQCIPQSQKGQPNGVCELDILGKVPTNRLYASQTPAPNILPLTKSDGKLDAGFINTASPEWVKVQLSSGGINYGQELALTFASPSGDLVSWVDVTNKKITIPANTPVLVSVMLRVNMKGLAFLRLVQYSPASYASLIAPVTAPEGFTSNAASSGVTTFFQSSSPIVLQPRLALPIGSVPSQSVISSVDSQSFIEIVRL